MNVPGAPGLQLGSSMTIAFWMKKTAEAVEWVRLVGKGGFWARNYGVWDDYPILDYNPDVDNSGYFPRTIHTYLPINDGTTDIVVSPSDNDDYQIPPSFAPDFGLYDFQVQIPSRQWNRWSNQVGLPGVGT